MAVVVVLAMVLSLTVVCNGGVTSTFVRKVESTVDMPLKVMSSKSLQVHITQGNQKGTAMIVSWVTMAEPGSSVVIFWSEKHKPKKAEGKAKQYKFYDYTSGYIHHCNIRGLEP
ncbi:hypothetical protein DVH24_009099 [Malus domestica]|uniref:Purple acid phosphatase N-terminal domain-containing protein n=1 Tax=Malus domestica TaxID=3750 RepID=A0A498JND4_MALDO|nr:hypothetical protein DVH24_009099 [Malus domestica]